MFALDLSENYIRVLELRKVADNFFLQGLGGKPIATRKEFSSLLKQLVAQAKPNPILSPDVALAIPEEESFIKIIPTPKHDQEEVAKFINEEITKIIPYEEKEVYWDWKVIEPMAANGMTQVMITACPKSVIDNYIGLIMEAGFTPALIETEANALLWGIQNPKHPLPNREPILAVNIGNKKTTAIIIAQDAIRFSASISVEMAANDNTTKEYLAVEWEEWVKSNKQETRLTEKSLTALSKKLREYIDYYQENLLAESDKEGQAVKGVVVSGAWANFPEVLEFIGKKLGLPASKPSYPISLHPAYTVALGMAYRGLYEEALLR